MRRVLPAVALLTTLLVAAGTGPAGATATNVATEAEYRAALTALSSNSGGPHSITLTADITLDDGTDPIYSGAQSLTIDGDGHTIDAGGLSRILRVQGSAMSRVVSLIDLHLTGGANDGSGGAVYILNGEGRLNGVTITDSTAPYAGAITNGGPLTLVNSTISGNTATTAGGGIYGIDVDLTYSTVAGNNAPVGANLWIGSTLSAFASVIADPQGGGHNCALYGVATSGGYNWSTEQTCGLYGTGDTYNGPDPQLRALADNGGPTPTRYPSPGSPLVDAIPNGACSSTVTTDQRGASRPQGPGGLCDIGAVERTPLGPDYTVSDEDEYRAAVEEAAVDGGTSTITLDADIQLDNGGDPTYVDTTEALTVDGDGHTIDAGGTSRILLAATQISDVTVTARDIHLTGASSAGDGGALNIQNAALLIEDGILTGNDSGAQGGAVSADAFTVRRSVFSGNEAHRGGAVHGGPGSVSDSTFTANHATVSGGAMELPRPLSMTNSTIAANSAGVAGGGIHATDDIDRIEHVTIAANTAPNSANLRVHESYSFRFSTIAHPLGGGNNCVVLQNATSSTGNWTDDTSCGLPDDQEHVGDDARLGVLRGNAGPTPTMFPLWGSPLRDQIPNGDCSATLTADQRGIARPHPAGGPCDIGAIEAVYPPHGFTDVPGWVDTAVRWITSTVNDPPLMTGITPTVFDPNADITRAQFARLLYREAGAPDVTALPPHGFTDVPAWVDDAVQWARATNVMTGITPTLFKPNDPITRAQVARAKYRFAGEQDTTGFEDPPFTDVPAWVQEAVDWTWEHQLMTGITPTTFRPNDPITRAQVARLDERLGLSPWAWDDPTTAPPTLPFRPDTP